MKELPWNQQHNHLGAGKNHDLPSWQPEPAQGQAAATFTHAQPGQFASKHTGQSQGKPPANTLTTDGNFKYSSSTRPKDKKSAGNSRAGGDPASQRCFHFNRNVTSACELPNNLCRNRRQHKCLTCNLSAVGM